MFILVPTGKKPSRFWAPNLDPPFLASPGFHHAFIRGWIARQQYLWGDQSGALGGSWKWRMALRKIMVQRSSFCRALSRPGSKTPPIWCGQFQLPVIYMWYSSDLQRNVILSNHRWNKQSTSGCPVDKSIGLNMFHFSDPCSTKCEYLERQLQHGCC